MRLNERQATIAREEFASVTFATGNRPHGHPLLHMGREIAEANVVGRIGAIIKRDGRTINPRNPACAMIIDHGGNPARHHAYRRANVHSVVSAKTPQDEIRNSRFDGMPNWCTSGSGNCRCLARPAYACMWIHSLYYYSPGEIIALLAQTTTATGFAVLHRFTGPSGSFYHEETTKARTEAHWTVDQHGDVVMTVCSTLNSYCHPDLRWVWMNPTFASDGARAMAWDIVDEVGPHIIIKLMLVQTKIEALDYKPVDYFSALADQGYYGTVDTKKLMSVASGSGYTTPNALEWKEIETWQFLSAGPNFMITWPAKSTKFVLPKGMIDTLRTEALHTDRSNPDVHARLIRAAKKLAAEDRSMSAAAWADVLPFVVVLGAVSGLNSEIQALSMMANYQEQISLHCTLRDMKFEGVVVLPWWVRLWPIQGLLQLAAAALPASWVRATGVFAGYVAANPWLLTLPAGLAIVALQRRYTLRYPFSVIDINWGRWAKWVDWKHPVAAAITAAKWALARMTHGLLRIAAVCYEAMPLVHQDPETHMTWDEPPPCEPRPAAWAYGVYCPHHIPVVAERCPHNERAALRNRILFAAAHDDEVDLVRWKPTIEFAKNNRLPFGREVVIEPDDFDEWLAHFPAKRREEIRKARAEVDKGAPVHSGISMFVKMELLPIRCAAMNVSLIGWRGSKAITGDAPARKAPRAIQARHDTLVATVGPHVYAYGRKLKEAWDWRRMAIGALANEFGKSRLTYTSGLSAEELGRWFDENVAALSGDIHDPVEGLEGDFSNYDGSQRAGAARLEKFLFRGIAQNERKLLTRKTRKGVTHGRLTYVIQYRRCSGDSQTSCGNSALTGILCLEAMVTNCARAAAVVQGDDNAILARRSDIELIAQTLMENCSERGLELKALRRPKLDDLEFCSGVFWPVNGTTIWGLKPGRMFMKTFISRKELTAAEQLAWVRGVAKSVERDTKHIPVARTLVTRMIQLTEGFVEMVPVKDYKIHARQGHEPGPDTWLFAARRYQVPTQALQDCEKYLAGVSLGQALTHWVIDAMIDVDAPLLAKAPLSAFTAEDVREVAKVAREFVSDAVLGRRMAPSMYQRVIDTVICKVCDSYTYLGSIAAWHLAPVLQQLRDHGVYETAMREAAPMANPVYGIITLTTTVAVVPTLEEILKRKSWWWVWVIAGVEAANALAAGCPLLACSKVVGHVALRLLPLRVAIAAHTYWNWSCCYLRLALAHSN